MAVLSASLPPVAAAGVRSCTVLLPDDVRPGQSTVKVDLGDGRSAEAKVPKQARSGDTLVLTLQIDGSWTGGLMRNNRDPAAKDSELNNCTARVPTHSRELVAVVPQGLEPGRGQFAVDAGDGQHLTITVPETARAGDKLLLQEERSDISRPARWRVQVIPNAQEWQALHLPSLEEDPQELFERLVHAVRSAGAFVNPKITRGVAPPLCIPGILACGEIDVGEEIIRIPAPLHLSAANCKKFFPELFERVDGMDMKGRNEEAAFAACITELIGKAVRCPASELMEQQRGIKTDGDNVVTALSVWELYAKVLASEPFGSHPYVRMHNSPGQVAAMMEPCQEHHHLKISVHNVNLFYYLLAKQSQSLGYEFTFSSYWQARLCMMSRSCELDGRMSLVPIFDFFNHHPQPGAKWSWDAESPAMVLHADRRHDIGEEILISYGPKSNVMSFLTYGFVLPPAVEPSWAFTCSPYKVPSSLYALCLPPSMADFTFQLETCHVDASLVHALNACLKHGSDAVNFLHAVCKHSLIAYESDPLLKPAIAALHEERREEPSSAAWWRHFKEEASLQSHSEDFPDWSMALLSVKMSEYLCLVAHLEIFDVLSGSITKDRCLSGAKIPREALLLALPMLRDGDEVVIRGVTR